MKVPVYPPAARAGAPGPLDPAEPGPAGRSPGRILLIVPAYNEEHNLPDLLCDLSAHARRLNADVLVVNDGSKDHTGRIAEQAPGVRAVHLPCNLGIGGAVQTGFKYAARKGYSIVIQVDGDGQHPPEEMEKLLQPIREGRADVVIGSRFLAAGGFRSSRMRQIGIRIFEWANRLLVGRRITDSTSGFRAYNARATRFLARYYPVDFPEPEAVVLLCRGGFRVEEVPVLMQAREGGVSSITTLRSAYYMIKVLLAVCIRAFS